MYKSTIHPHLEHCGYFQYRNEEAPNEVSKINVENTKSEVGFSSLGCVQAEQISKGHNECWRFAWVQEESGQATG